jgi:hypothetical protein
MPALNTPARPSDQLAAFCERLRGELVSPETPIEPAEVPLLLARFSQRLLAQAPADVALVAAVARLASRSFRLPPPAPDRLPLEAPARAWDELSDDDRRGVANALLALPDPVKAPAEARSVLSLLLRIPEEFPRARSLTDALARVEPPAEAALHRLRLALAEAAPAPGSASTRARPDWAQLLAPFRRPGDPAVAAALPAALRLAATYELRHPVRPDRLPVGLSWLAPFADGLAVANVTLARLRRPALAEEAARVLDWLVEAGPPAWLAEVERLDAAGAFASASRVLEDILLRHASASERSAVLAARSQLLCEGEVASPLAGLRFRLPEAAGRVPEAPRTGWASHLLALFGRSSGSAPGSSGRTPLALRTPEEAAIAGALEDTRLLADYLAETRSLALITHPGGRTRGEVLAALQLEVPADERLLVGPARDAALALHHLLAEHDAAGPDGPRPPGPQTSSSGRSSGSAPGSSGLARDLLALRLLGAGERPSGSVGSHAPPDAVSEGAPSGSVAAEAPPEVSPEEAPGSPHDPALRLRAAAELLAARQLAPASAILTALLRRGQPSPELLAVVAGLLEEDETAPEDTADLRVALARALDDDRRAAPILALLGSRPLAAFGLHADLYAHALDPSRPDARRLDALLAWLGIWVATDTPPDAAAVTRIREVGEPLLVLAALRLASRKAAGPGATGVLQAAAAFLASAGALPAGPFAERLLALAKGAP